MQDWYEMSSEVSSEQMFNENITIRFFGGKFEEWFRNRAKKIKKTLERI